MRQLDLISVRQHGSQPHFGRLTAGDIVLSCALGRSGVTEAKQEGDGASPVGTWPLRRVLFRPDRIDRPATKLPVSAISPDDGWCDDPADLQLQLPCELAVWSQRGIPVARRRTLRRGGRAGIQRRSAPPGLGSAIFFHLATPEFAPTAGCVAVHRPDMVRLLAHCGPGTKLEIAGAARDIGALAGC
jgi:L,D-peptidoglycan transpeptidase YkuD (ErfK/YbiS/YcfS/YnhG family)